MAFGKPISFQSGRAALIFPGGSLPSGQLLTDGCRCS